jgi:hypothetical protein
LKPRVDEDRQRDIDRVIGEKKEMVKVGQNLLPLLDKASKSEEVSGSVWGQIDSDILELCGHLGIIKGFCDRPTQEMISRLVWLLNYFDTYLRMSEALKTLLPFVMGLEVDFNKRPFRVVGIDIEALRGKFSAYLER